MAGEDGSEDHQRRGNSSSGDVEYLLQISL